MKNPIIRLAPLLLLLATAVVYARALSAPYLWDDISLIGANPTLDDHANIPRYFVEDLGHFNRDPREMGFYRPMQALTFHLETALFGRLSSLQRTINMLLHALAAIAVWLLALAMLESPVWALIAGLLFAVHPLCSEQVCLIANRGGLLAACLSLWTLVMLTRAVPSSGPVDRRRLAGAAMLYALALLTKPTALIVIAPAVAWLLLFRPKQRANRAAWLAVAAMPAALALAYVAWRWGILGISHAHKASPVDLSIRLLAMPRLTIEAVRLTLIPTGLRAIRSPDLAAWAAWPSALLSTLLWLAVLVAAWLARRKMPIVTFAAVLLTAALAPASGIIAIVRPVAEHYYYLPAAAMALALAGLGAAASRHKWSTVVAALLVLLFALGTVDRAGDWRSEQALWEDNVRHEPTNSQALNNLGTVLADQGKKADALALFDRAVAADPNNIKSHINRANLAMILERYETIYEDLAPVLHYDHCHLKALILLGHIVVLHPTYEVDALARRLKQEQKCAVALLVGQGMAFEKHDRFPEALVRYRQFLDLAPGHPLAGAVRAKVQKLSEMR